MTRGHRSLMLISVCVVILNIMMVIPASFASSSYQDVSVKISLSNTQSTPVAAGTQLMIKINSSAYSAYENTNLGNVRFFNNSAMTSHVYAWCESGCTSASTDTVWWIKYPTSIPATTGVGYVWLEFVSFSTPTTFDSYTGEAPQLSSTYAQYDNGANVFTQYWNFAGTTLPAAFTSAGTPVVNNGVTLTNAGITESTAYNNAVYVTESYEYATGGSSSQYGDLPMMSLTGESESAGIEWQPHVGASPFLGYYITGWNYGTQLLGFSTTAYQIVSTWMSGTELYGSVNYATPQSANAVAAGGSMKPDWNAENSMTTYILFIRTRLLPPNNTFPTTTFGAVVQTCIPTTVASPSGLNWEYWIFTILFLFMPAAVFGGLTLEWGGEVEDFLDVSLICMTIGGWIGVMASTTPWEVAFVVSVLLFIWEWKT